MKLRNVQMIAIISVLSGCAMNPNNKAALVNKNEVTVESALRDIGTGIGEMKKALDERNSKAGVYVDSIDLDLVLSTTSDEHGKLTLGLNPIDFKSLSKIKGSLDSEIYKSLVDNRNSTVRIRFKSINTLNKPPIVDTVINQKRNLDCNGKDKDSIFCP